MKRVSGSFSRHYVEVSRIGIQGTYAVYAVLCFAGYVFVDKLVFETKVRGV